MTKHPKHRFLLPIAIAAAAMTLAAQSLPAHADGLSTYDGVYSGFSTPAMAISGCGQTAKSITIHVRNGEAWTHHHRLAGQVDASGNLSMQDGGGIAHVTGSIVANNLTASETVPETPAKLGAAYDNNATICSYTINASRGG
ncbi:hypothetical protein ACELLULO517_19605 [Acidisoma cellulosilytica]|uniref:Uncharacterized protein n=1 Tax=Acidisoma cellulosilyticum TaxID=2802395 RepID=A0A964E5F5_9PROT|nr:hypothetical protein [Acidisoma cellulosilyticum]MCB8882464.1 hypothetical protein [Acidisoma cellulosilyticum]